MIALLLILPTLAFVPIYFFILPAIFIAIRNFNENKGQLNSENYFLVNKNFLLIVLIIVCTALNKWFHYYDTLEGGEWIPRTIAMVVGFYIAKNLRKKDLELIVLFIVIECLVVCVQYYLGVNTFFEEFSEFNKNLAENPNRLYFRRPLGLSENSSVVAYKFLIAYIILDYLKLKGHVYNVFRFLLVLGIFFTFNRTVFLAAFVYIFYSMVKLYSPIIQQLLEKRIALKNIKYVVFAFFALLGVFAFYYLYVDAIIAQVTRGNGLDLSGRGGIWRDFSAFISDHFYFGNGSEKVQVPYRGKEAHAHNSYLQIIATHGIFIFGLYMLMILRNLKKSNWIFVLVIMVYSSFQYGIFWGISLLDILLYLILFFEKPTGTDYLKTKIPMRFKLGEI